MNSLSNPRFAATLALHSLMDQAQVVEISQRVRSLKDASRETNRSIADYCDVTERTVAGWVSPREPKPMTWDHAEKVSELFKVDVDWLWRGREKGPAPDVLDALNGSGRAQLDRIDANLTRLLVWAGLEPTERSQEVADRLSEEAGDVLPTADERDQREPAERETAEEGP